MTTQAIVTDTRVIMPDNATPAEMRAAGDANPGKSVFKASSLKPGFAVEDSKELASVKARVAKLEAQVQQLLAAQQKTQPVRAAVLSEEAPAPVIKPEPKVEVAPAPAPKVEEPKAVTKSAPAPKKVEAPKPAPKAEAKPKRMLSELPMDELKAKVIKLGGNPDRILKGKHARARTKALVAWIVRKRAALKAAK